MESEKQCWIKKENVNKNLKKKKNKKRKVMGESR